MSVSAQVPYKKYTAAPAATVFPTTFRVVLATDLQVRVNAVVVTTGFTLSALGLPAGLDVTFTAPMVGGEVVELQRIIPKSRATDYQQLGNFDAGVVNADIDRTWMSIQEVDAEVKRSVRIPASSTVVSLDLPAPTALTYLRWNSLANALENVLLANVSLISLSPYAQTILDAVSAAAARVVLGATSFGGAVFTAVDAAAARLAILAAKSGANSDITSLTGLTTGLAATGCRGLLGAVNAVTPLTKFDLSATQIVMANSTGNTVVENTIASSTVDLELAGSIVNGRDQAAAFPVSSWIHIHRIYNGTTKGWLASLSATAPALPSGYTYSTYATTIRKDASGNIVACYVRGATVTQQAEATALASGTSTAEAAVSLTTHMPPNALALGCGVFLNNTGTANQGVLRLVTGVTFVVIYVQGSQYAYRDLMIPNIGQSVIYAAGATSVAMSILVQYYRIANGDA